MATLKQIVERIVEIQKTIPGISATVEPPLRINDLSLPCFVNTPGQAAYSYAEGSDTLTCQQRIDMMLVRAKVASRKTNEPVGDLWPMVEAVQRAFFDPFLSGPNDDPLVETARLSSSSGFVSVSYTGDPEEQYICIRFTLDVRYMHAMNPY